MYSSSSAMPLADGPIGSPGPIEPSAPVVGYETVSEKYSEYCAPPTYETAIQASSNITPYFPIELSKEEIREAVRVHVKSKINYSSKAVDEMVYKDIKQSVAYVYRLTTLLETRKTKRVHAPYDGSYIDGPMNGPAPNGWSIFIKSPDTFVNGKSGAVAIPHTETVQPCFSCHGSTRQRCSSCSGRGNKSCTWCSGSGTRSQGGSRVSCSSCNGTGRDRCTFCLGVGSKSCTTCNARGSLKYWIQIKAHWSVVTDEFVSTCDKLKEKDIAKASGFPMLDETHERVQGLQSSQYMDETVVMFSQSATTKPATGARILRQNQSIKGVPITAVEFAHKDSGTFYVYGTDKRVHFDHYPSKNCCISWFRVNWSNKVALVFKWVPFQCVSRSLPSWSVRWQEHQVDWKAAQS